MAEQLVAVYEQKAKEYTQKANEVLNKKQEASSANTRTQEDTAIIRGLLNSSVAKRPLTAEQVLNTDSWNDLEKDFVLCSEDDAGRIFDRQIPRFPILIGPLTGTTGRIKEFLNAIDPEADIDVHDFGRDVSVDFRDPRPVKARDAIKMFEDENRTDPLNFLDLHILKDNPLPSFLGHRKDFRILDYSQTRKRKRRSQQNAVDLDRWTSFQLLASEGAAHLPHIDHHGMNTVVFNEEGDKLWLMWPGLGLDGIKKWRLGEPLKDGLPVYVPPGYVLWQPLGTLHAPITITKCLMRGRMLLHSSQLLDALRYTKAEIEDPDMTNETFCQQIHERMKGILDLWKRELDLAEVSQKTFNWPPSEAQNECEEIYKVS
ncbi:hypothetical protein FMUND_11910 [Fusarium mundagurra]|uniref:JmjC domain-containing protein n=1 Tax=Fusarium mundagurra TaxID=1567541 RepID=A0A8H6D6I1_9HYPO|nr:hypothetical protein FMUND_11910 [Fusarium mundagurra]